MAYKALVALHVLGVLGAVGSVAIEAGYFGAALVDSSSTRPGVDRYFSRGPGWSDRLLYPAAAFGLAALLASHARVSPQRSWVWIPALMWAAATLILEAVQRPAASVIAVDPTSRQRAARRGFVAAMAVLGLLIASAAVMTSKP